MFDYDWFHGAAFHMQLEESVRRCVLRRFPDVSRDDYETNDEVQEFGSKLETRTLIYLRDGFSYEVREFADLDSKSQLSFECEPVDEHYKVGAFVVTVLFEEIVRVEVFAVHPDEKPNDSPQITGFRHFNEPQDQKAPIRGEKTPTREK
ncbi:MAG: hypothetical protein IH987_13145 [Planctomycetes bacterium]|nr:hypothetical protein [Planctomycetota bacterium]